jgi:lysozyme
MMKRMTLIAGFLLLCSEGFSAVPDRITPPPGWETDTMQRVLGIDVSVHQGKIEWAQVKENGVRFAYIKATEGKDYVDKRYAENTRQARQEGIATGAYHFFLFNTSGREQADHFIRTVQLQKGDLPPVVDVEAYRNPHRNLSDRAITASVQVFVYKIYNHYGIWPVIYADMASYKRYIRGYFPGCPLWLCDLNKEPAPDDGRGWLFWQYAHTGRMKGISGPVDLDIFRGTPEDFSKFLNKTSGSDL